MAVRLRLHFFTFFEAVFHMVLLSPIVALKVIPLEVEINLKSNETILRPLKIFLVLSSQKLHFYFLFLDKLGRG